MTAAIEMAIAAAIVIALVVFRERGARHVVSFQSKYFAAKNDVADVRWWILAFAFAGVLFIADRGCRYFE